MSFLATITFATSLLLTHLIFLKLGLDKPSAIYQLLALYTAVHALLFGVYYYIYLCIKASPNDSRLCYVEPRPWGPDEQINRTVSEYDISMLKRDVRAILFYLGIDLALHFYGRVPLVYIVNMALSRSIIDMLYLSPLVQIHVLGRPASGDLARPFALGLKHARNNSANIEKDDSCNKVRCVTSLQEFEDLLNNNSLVVVDFYATWCGPCKAIAPRFEAMADSNPKAVFLKVNVEVTPEIASKQSVRAMPTFQIFKNGKLIDQVVGTNITSLSASVRSLHAGEL